MDDKRKLHELLKQINSRDGIGRESLIPTRPSSLYSSSRSGRHSFAPSAGIFELQGMEDMELLTDVSGYEFAVVLYRM